MFDLAVIQAVNRPYPDKTGVTGYARLSAFSNWLQTKRDTAGKPAFKTEAATHAEKAFNRRVVLLANALKVTLDDSRYILRRGDRKPFDRRLALRQSD